MCCLRHYSSNWYGYLNLLHHSPLLKKTWVRRVVLDQWFPLNNPWNAHCSLGSESQQAPAGLSQWSTEVPLRRSALSVCPCGDSWGTLLQEEIRHWLACVKPPRGRTPRSPRPKVTSVLSRLCARSAAAERTALGPTQPVPNGDQ